MPNYLDIAIGILQRDGQYCLSRRQKHQSFADKWEFPGGKVEAGEQVVEALQREFREELSVNTECWQPLIVVPWVYQDVAVRLHVFVTDTFSGEPVGNEGQQIRWFDIEELDKLDFPAANRGIVSAMKLADKYMNCGKFADMDDALDKLSTALHAGVRLCQLKAKGLDSEQFAELADKAIALCHQHQATILLNGPVELLESHPQADGIQLASNTIYEFESRPISANKLLGVSVHSDEDIQQALNIGADFLLLSPLRETSAHPGVPGIGWDEFAEKVREIPIPVYALGGVKPEDAEEAKRRGGQGVSTTSGLWPA